MGILDVFRGRASSQKGDVGADSGLDAAHLALQRAILRCDSLRPAYDAGQMTIEELVSKLRYNNFEFEVIRKAVEESWGMAVPERLLSE
ncbi:MAG: hypothetical protein ABIG71_01660 [Candidatus Uhrbacteria bacterium]